MSYFLRDQNTSRGESTKIREIPKLSSATKISQLNFSHNDIRGIPPHITSVVNLQLIDLSHNKIGKLEHLFDLTSLKFINLSHNLITQIPDDILQLIQIQNLDLGFNRISILNNIKILKQLVQIRTFKWKGFIEINLEGNEVLKKKGCRDIYKKWMNPCVEDVSRISQKVTYDSLINRTKKRQSKSADLQVKYKENPLMSTNKTLEIVQNGGIERSKDGINTSQHQTEKMRLSPNISNYEESKQNHQRSIEFMKSIVPVKSQIIKGGFNIKDLSGIASDDRQTGNIAQWFLTRTQKLKQLNNIFTLIITNQDIKNLENDVKQRIIEQSLYAKELINISQEVMTQVNISKEDQKKYQEEMVLICDKIREMHRESIRVFNEKENLPVKFYKPWVVYFRQLKQIAQAIPHKIDIQNNKHLRQQQIQDLINISPEKQEVSASFKPQQTIPQSASKGGVNRQLDDLLFSNKDDYLLLSDCKRSNSEKKLSIKDDTECQNCLMKKWEGNRARQDIKELQVRNQKLEVQKKGYLQQILQLERFRDKYCSLTEKQDLIIDELEGLEPSTYQNILLEQAKTIEYMIAREPMVGNEIHNFRQEPESGNPMYSISVSTGKQKQILKTRLVSDKMSKDEGSNHISKRVSEFTIEGSQELGGFVARSSSYFKNKNIVTTINRTGEESKTLTLTNQQNLTTEENKQRSQDKIRKRNEIVVSQFNSEVNSMPSSQKKKKQDSYSKKVENRQQSMKRRASLSSNQSKGRSKTKSITNNRTKRPTCQITQKTQNDVILLSQNSAPKHNESHISPLMKKHEIRQEKSSISDYLRSQEFIKIMGQKLISHRPQPNYKDSFCKYGGQIELKGRSSLNQRGQSKGCMEVESNKQNINPQKLKRTKTIQSTDQLYLNKYNDHSYLPMHSNEADSYRKYMQYHLRNNIIGILSKKSGTALNEFSGREKKYLYMTNSQKLIRKRPQSVNQVKEVERSRCEVNKTFR